MKFFLALLLSLTCIPSLIAGESALASYNQYMNMVTATVASGDSSAQTLYPAFGVVDALPLYAYTKKEPRKKEIRVIRIRPLYRPYNYARHQTKSILNTRSNKGDVAVTPLVRGSVKSLLSTK